MKRLISFKLAVHISLVIFSAVMLFHVGVLTGLVPSNIVWGGKVPEDKLAVFELISVAVNGIFMIAVIIHAGYLKAIGLRKVARVGMWIMFVIFALNTFGNLFAETMFEKAVMTPITLILALLSLRMAQEKTVPEE